jgi:hypothetical protein
MTNSRSHRATAVRPRQAKNAAIAKMGGGPFFLGIARFFGRTAEKMVRLHMKS